MFLKIESKGVCPKEGFTVFGVSLTRYSNNSNTIGQFGSGNKHGVAVLLRNRLTPTIYCGSLGLDFFTRTQEVKSDTESHEFERVCVKYSGKEDGKSKTATEELGFVLDYGTQDWDELNFALREFVSNAIDSSCKEVGDWSTVRVEMVNANQVRAKDGYTRVYIPATPEVYTFYHNLGKWFLHFSEPESLNLSILPKRDRNLGETKTAVIYRKGVRVREIESDKTNSLFDYNLDIKLDECRRVDDWSVKYAATNAFAKAKADDLQVYFTSLTNETKFWEHSFDAYTLRNATYSDEAKANWLLGASRGFGSDSIITDARRAELVRKKGYNAIVVSEELLHVFDSYDCPTHRKILSGFSALGREEKEPTLQAETALHFVWQKLLQYGLTNGKDMPKAKCFVDIMSSESSMLGCYYDGVVYINESIAPNAMCLDPRDLSLELIQTMIEEVAHYVTGATDNSRDFQDFAFKVAASLMKRG